MICRIDCFFALRMTHAYDTDELNWDSLTWYDNTVSPLKYLESVIIFQTWGAWGLSDTPMPGDHPHSDSKGDQNDILHVGRHFQNST